MKQESSNSSLKFGVVWNIVSFVIDFDYVLSDCLLRGMAIGKEYEWQEELLERNKNLRRTRNMNLRVWESMKHDWNEKKKYEREENGKYVCRRLT